MIGSALLFGSPQLELFLRLGNNWGQVFLSPSCPALTSYVFPHSESFPRLSFLAEAELREPTPLPSVPYWSGPSLILGLRLIQSVPKLFRDLSGWSWSESFCCPGLILSESYVVPQQNTHKESPSPLCISYGRWCLVLWFSRLKTKTNYLIVFV